MDLSIKAILGDSLLVASAAVLKESVRLNFEPSLFLTGNPQLTATTRLNVNSEFQLNLTHAVVDPDLLWSVFNTRSTSAKAPGDTKGSGRHRAGLPLASESLFPQDTKIPWSEGFVAPSAFEGGFRGPKERERLSTKTPLLSLTPWMD